MQPKPSQKVHHLFEQQVIQTPDAIALQSDTIRFTYQELNNQANRLAAVIQYQYNDSSVIAISAFKSIDSIIGILAILKAGKTYLPLDRTYPVDRLRYMISNASISSCICTNEEAGFFQSIGLKTISKDQTTAQSLNVEAFNESTAAVYILHTSGSTGVPKAVSLNHPALINLLKWQAANSIAGQATKTLQLSPLTFDPSFLEIFATFSTGGILVLMDDDIRLDPERLLRFINQDGINRIYLPYVALQYLCDMAQQINLFPSCLHELITAGEALRITPSIKHFFKRNPTAHLYNQYGPTETHVVTALALEGDPDNWPLLPSIGIPIADTGIWIVDEQLQLLNNGESGELLISGVSLADEYLNAPELTNEKFIQWNHPEKGWMRVYRTGDIAAYLPDGNIQFLGRKDEQVKIRGYRIELGEIEIALMQIEGISQAVVTVIEEQEGIKKLVAYIQATDSKKPVSEIREKLSEKLPAYMLPSIYCWVDEMPKTSSGKINKKALPLPSIERPSITTIFETPSTQSQKAIAAIWKELLSWNEIGIKDNFFELGGNSLLAMKCTIAIKKHFNQSMPISRFYQYPTIGALANYFDGNHQDLKLNQYAKNENADPANMDIAIIGLNGRFPGADSIEALWEILQNGKETTRFFNESELDPSINASIYNDPNYVKARGIINHPDFFDAAFFGISPTLATLMDPQQRIFLEICWEILEKTGHLPNAYNGRTGVFAGTGNNSYYLKNILSNKEKVIDAGEFLVMTHNEKDYVASRTAYALNLNGPAVGVYAACATSLLAIAQAAESIRNGHCEVALAGGVSITVPINSGHFYQEGAMLSKDGHCRTFDASANGTVFSDGAGVVLLKRKDLAIKDGDTILGLIKGIGVNNDGIEKGSFTAPSAIGQAGAIYSAIQQAGVNPSDINYVEAHGTATPIGDPIEVEGLQLAFGNDLPKQYCAIGSIKSNIGHLTAAAGVAGFIKTSLMLQHKMLVPSILFEQPNPEIQFDKTAFYVNTDLKQLPNDQPMLVGVSSFGVGGTNVHLILSSFEQAKPISDLQKKPVIISWSAKTISSVKNYAIKLLQYIEQNKELNIADLAYTLHKTKPHFLHRSFIIAENRKDLINQLNDYINDVSSPQIAVSDLAETANHWMNNQEVDFLAIYIGEQRVLLNDVPTYAFDKKSYWIEPAPSIALNALVAKEIPATHLPSIKERLRSIIIDISGEEESILTDEANFADIGLDSLVLTQLAIQVSKAFSIQISFRQLNEEFDQINSLAEFIQKNQPKEDLLITKPTKTTVSINEDQKEALEKPFGAIARIEKNKTDLTDQQMNFIKAFTKKYNERTAESKKYTQQYRMEMADPRVVSGFKPVYKELIYPIVVNHSNGAMLKDIDGNDYIDVLNGFGSNFLGYQFPAIKKAIQQQIEDGYEIGPQHVLAGEVCSLINELTQSERSALCNTGSEAVLGAMRIARTVTGKSLIVSFNGSYHGINDEVIVRGKNQQSYPAAPGILPESVSNMLVLDYGTDETLQIIKARANEIAAILVEPVQSRRPEFLPVDFLHSLRAFSSSNNVVLIFDEVITGFRSHPGGVQALIGIQADISTYGKVVGGGMPIGVIAGKRKMMDSLDGGYWQFGDTSIPEIGVTYFAGTFVRHPLALAAAKASLTYMKQESVLLQQKINDLTELLVKGLKHVIVKNLVPYEIVYFSSLWKIKIKDDFPYAELLFTLMRHKGIHIWDGFPCFLTNAHTEADINKIIDTFAASVSELIDGGFLRKKTLDTNINKPMDLTTPPISGALLGRNQDGNPAWFIKDPKMPNNYIQLKEA
ncbi:MAG: amino acid adenylation domain-containing protein [Sphingobacteriia bacterium]|jgi:amino acid adenylation domain-containing protein